MGSKRFLLAVLVFILLSSSVSAVSFEWALGNSATEDSRSRSYHNEWNECFVWEELDTIEKLPTPVIVLYEFIEGASCANRCSTKVFLELFYKDNLAFQWMPKFNRGPFQDRSKSINVIADRAYSGGSCDWAIGSPGSCSHPCDFDGNIAVRWVDVDVSGKGAVFPDDGVVSLGRIKDLYPKDIMPENETIHIGLYTYNPGDVMYWFGELNEEPSRPLKMETDDYYEYVNVCSDVNHNLVCDNVDAESCNNEGADWYGDSQMIDGACCGHNPDEIHQQTGLNSFDCGSDSFDGKAYCGQTVDGNWKWAPLYEVGAVYSLLSCPGASMVSDGRKFIMCHPGDKTDFFPITHTLGTHGYICSDGEIFECTGDLPSYSENQDFVAETGVSTNDLIGSGGCPPKIVAYWPLDGDALDVVNSFDGAVAGAGSVSGKIDDAFHFEVGNKITFPSALSITGDQFTVEAWIKPTQTSGVRKIIEKENSFRIAVDSELLVGAVNTDSPMIDFGSRRIVSNAWHHIALVYDGEKALLYLDGVAVSDDGVSGDIVWSGKPIILGGSFIGDIDEVAVYDKALRSSLIKRHSKFPSGYCQETGESSENYYCASDGEWTSDLDTKDESSCNKAGFVWTGNFCCSEDDDPDEYYNDYDTPAASLAMAPEGQTIAAHAGAQVESSQVILKNVKQYVTIKGPAKLQVETYSAESPDDLGSCPELKDSPQIVDIAPWENRTLRVSSLGRPGSSCRYRWKIITAKPLLALGGCWNKEFIPIGHFAASGILNYHGAFFSCGLSANAAPLNLKDYHTNEPLVVPASPDCDSIMLNARGSGIHTVCNPGYMWQFTNNSAANTPAKTKWNVTKANASQWGCCTENQCWTGFDCSNIGSFYEVGGTSYYCGE